MAAAAGAPAPTRPARPGGPPGAAGAAETPVNVAPRGTDLNLRGFVEAEQWDILNSFVAALDSSGWFEKIEILEREPADADQIATRFFIRATLKTDHQPVLLP
jgi:hypothetical protein